MRSYLTPGQKLNGFVFHNQLAIRAGLIVAGAAAVFVTCVVAGNPSAALETSVGKTLFLGGAIVCAVGLLCPKINR